MNIQEAIKSGKKFKRKGTPHFLSHPDVKHGEFIMIRLNDFFAEDWEVEEKKITATESEFKRAFDEAQLKSMRDGYRLGSSDVLRELFK
jgi:hypothetical protein